MQSKGTKILCIVFAVLAVLLAAALVWQLFCGAQTRMENQRELDLLKAENAQAAAELKAENEAALQALKAENEQALKAAQSEKDALALQKDEELAAIREEYEGYIAGFKLYKNVISQDEVEQTLFGQPISEERNGEYRLAVKTAVDGDFHAELSIYKAENGKYKKLFTCPAVVGKNGPGKQSEGDTKTPLGTWTIGKAYGIKDDPGSLVPYTKVTDDMYWCATGSNGKKYNTLIYKSEDPDADYSEDEHLIDLEIVYNYLLDLGYNAPGAPYAGNAIFLHCWRGPDEPTGGCVGISEENMVKVLETVPPGTAVTIY